MKQQLSGGTGGEVFSLVLSKLIEIKNEKAYLVVKEEIDAIIQYAKAINYLHD